MIVFLYVTQNTIKVKDRRNNKHLALIHKCNPLGRKGKCYFVNLTKGKVLLCQSEVLTPTEGASKEL